MCFSFKIGEDKGVSERERGDGGGNSWRDSGEYEWMGYSLKKTVWLRESGQKFCSKQDNRNLKLYFVK